MNNFAVRITYPYTVVERVIARWSTHCQRIACYEHNDDGAERLHCHLHLENVNVSSKRLSQLANEAAPMTVPQEGRRASSLISFRGKEYDKNIAGYAYLTKGKYEPSYLQGFTKEQSDLWKASWVVPAEHAKRDSATILFDDFISWWNDKENRLDLDQEVTTQMLLSRAHKFLRSRTRILSKFKYLNEKWVLIQNYCDLYQIKYPEYWKEF